MSNPPRWTSEIGGRSPDPSPDPLRPGPEGDAPPREPGDRPLDPLSAETTSDGSTRRRITVRTDLKGSTPIEPEPRRYEVARLWGPRILAGVVLVAIVLAGYLVVSRGSDDPTELDQGDSAADLSSAIVEPVAPPEL